MTVQASTAPRKQTVLPPPAQQAYLTHCLVGPRFDLLDAVRSWRSDDWRRSYPAGSTTRLEAPVGVPAGKVLTDEALSTFLANGPLTPADANLATLTVPARLGADG